MFVSGSQVLYGRYLARDRSRINHLFTATLMVSGGLGLLTSALLVLGVFTGATRHGASADAPWGVPTLGSWYREQCSVIHA